MSQHRKAPLPDSMKRHATPGVCRWCDLPIDTKGRPTRRTWHPACVKEFKLIHWPAETRRATFERDKGVCVRCRVDLVALKCQRWPQYSRESNEVSVRRDGLSWQHDHIRPLIEANGDLSFWLMDNIQTLCTACHIQKGKEDNLRRKLARQAINGTVELSLG